MTSTTATKAAGSSGRERSASRHTLFGLVIVAVLLFPVYWMVNVSLQPGGRAVGTPWFPINPDLSGYATAITEQSPNLVTSLLVAGGSVLFSLVIAAPAAYAVAQLRIPFARTLLFAVLICQMIPGIVVSNALYTAFNQLGLLNSIVGLIIANSSAGIPFGILIMHAFMLSIPPSVIEAARVDGAGPVRAFVSIVLPMSRNAIITAGLFAFLFAWGDFLFAVTLTTTNEVRPVTVGLYSYLGTYVNDWSAVMATAVLASTPAIAVLAVAQRYIAAGATGGAVK